MRNTKVPIVILHGWNLSGSRFQPLVTAFKQQGFDVFAPDLPGFGTQPKPDRPFTLEDYAEFVNQFLQKKKIKKCILIGHSFGGRVGLIFSKIYKSKVHALILTGVPIFPPVPKLKMKAFLIIAKIGGILFQLPVLSFIAEPVKKFLYKISGSSDYYRTEGVMRATFRLIIKQDLLPALQSLTIPTLMIWGEKDIITPLWIARKAVKILNNCHSERSRGISSINKLIIIPNERHMVAVNQPQEFVDYVRSFLNAL